MGVFREAIYGVSFDNERKEDIIERREEIVRCRDCKHFFPHFTRHDPDLPHYCETHGSDWVWPDGFCAWGVRNDA